jgi:hypothetical protein
MNLGINIIFNCDPLNFISPFSQCKEQALPIVMCLTDVEGTLIASISCVCHPYTTYQKEPQQVMIIFG